jgi:hypothetical protein
MLEIKGMLFLSMCLLGMRIGNVGRSLLTRIGLPYLLAVIINTLVGFPYIRIYHLVLIALGEHLRLTTVRRSITSSGKIRSRRKLVMEV